MTELQDGQQLERLVKVYGIEGKLAVKITTDGISFRVPGTKQSVNLTWAKALAASETPSNVPCWLAGDPVKFLTTAVEKVQKRRAKKETA